MTKLEEEIRIAIENVPYKRIECELYDCGYDLVEDYEATARAAAEVAKRYIEKAFDAGNFYTAKGGMRSSHDEDRAAWLKENGITE